MRPASLKLCAVNIVIMEPEMHSPDAYARLFRDLAKMEMAIRARGEQFLEMDSYVSKSESAGLLYGTLHRFTAIDAMNWFNREKHRRATDTERSQIRIPANLEANYREIPFAVHLKTHRMVFVTKSSRPLVSPTQVQAFIERLAARPAIYAKYGEVTVTIEQDEQALEQILQSDSIRSLKVTVNRPNESFRKFDKQIFERLNKMRAKQLSEEYHAEDKAGLKPDQDLLDTAVAATSNGSVDAKVVVDGRITELSTVDKPLQELVTYDSRKEGVLEGFRRGVKAVLKRIGDKGKHV